MTTGEGKTFTPDVLLGDGAAVTAKVVAHERGPKIRIGKYRRRTGYKRHNGFRAAITRIEISLGGAQAQRRRRPCAEGRGAEAGRRGAGRGGRRPQAPAVEAGATRTSTSRACRRATRR